MKNFFLSKRLLYMAAGDAPKPGKESPNPVHETGHEKMSEANTKKTNDPKEVKLVGNKLVEKAQDALPKLKDTPEEKAAFRDLKWRISGAMEGLHFLGSSHSPEEVRKIVYDTLQVEMAKVEPKTMELCRSVLEKRKPNLQHIRTAETLLGNPPQACFIDVRIGGNNPTELQVKTYTQKDVPPLPKFIASVTAELMAIPKNSRTEMQVKNIIAKHMTEKVRAQLGASTSAQNHLITLQILEDTGDPYDSSILHSKSLWDVYIKRDGTLADRVQHDIKPKSNPE